MSKKVRHSAEKHAYSAPRPESRKRGQGSFNLARLRAGLKPFRLYWYPRLRSTNDHAISLRKHGQLFAPAVILTGHQLAGRGRGANTWWSSGGVLTVTFVLPVDESLPPQELPLVAGLAVRDAAAEITGQPSIELKWPNDVLHDGRKLAGLLCERVNKADLVGVGLNANVDPTAAPKKLRTTLTSLSSIAGRSIDITDVLISVASYLLTATHRRREQTFAAFLRQYERHHYLVGRRISILSDDRRLTGRCEGIDSAGRLILRDCNTIHRIIAGHVLTEE
jgi:BirA family biotin operon repressor/biotin-[acetyl-CoA-carboxylase] ligase